MPPKRKAPISDTGLSKWAQQLEPEQLLCRDLGHTWKPSRVFKGKLNSFIQVLRCTQCKALRRREINRYGQVLGASYTYPEGYLAPTGVFATSSDGRSQLRLLSLQRMMNDDSIGSEPEADGA